MCVGFYRIICVYVLIVMCAYNRHKTKTKKQQKQQKKKKKKKKQQKKSQKRIELFVCFLVRKVIEFWLRYSSLEVLFYRAQIIISNRCILGNECHGILEHFKEIA